MQLYLDTACTGLVAIQPINASLVIATGFVVAVLILAVAVAVVAILSVVSKHAGRRSSGIRVLRELRLMLRDLVSALRNRWGRDPDESDK